MRNRIEVLFLVTTLRVKGKRKGFQEENIFPLPLVYPIRKVSMQQHRSNVDLKVRLLIKQNGGREVTTNRKIHGHSVSKKSGTLQLNC